MVVIPLAIYESRPNFARLPDVVVWCPLTNPPKYNDVGGPLPFCNYKDNSRFQINYLIDKDFFLIDGLDISVNGVFCRESRNHINARLNFLSALGFKPGSYCGDFINLID
jgi:hypothetical protein